MPNKKLEPTPSVVYFPKWALSLAKKWVKDWPNQRVECLFEEGEGKIASLKCSGEQADDYSLVFLERMLRAQINSIRHSSPTTKGFDHNGVIKIGSRCGLVRLKSVLGRVEWAEHGEKYVTKEMSHLPSLGQQERPEGWDEDLVLYMCSSDERPREPKLDVLGQKFPTWHLWRDGSGANLCQWAWAHCTPVDAHPPLAWLEEYEKRGGDPLFKNKNERGMWTTLTAFRGHEWNQVRDSMEWFDRRGAKWWEARENVSVESIMMRKFEREGGGFADFPDEKERIVQKAKQWFAQKERDRLSARVGVENRSKRPEQAL